MLYKDALKLKEGDRVIHKSNGYIITVKGIDDRKSKYNFNDYVFIKGTTKEGFTVTYNHKEVNKYKE